MGGAPAWVLGSKGTCLYLNKNQRQIVKPINLLLPSGSIFLREILYIVAINENLHSAGSPLSSETLPEGHTPLVANGNHPGVGVA